MMSEPKAGPIAAGGREGSALRGGPVPTSAADSSPWAPLRRPTFRWLWLGVLISTIGTWMQTVGAQWLVVDEPSAAVLVSLVQAANTLPVMLLAFPGGVLADAFDRRWLLLTVQGYFFAVGVLLAVLTAAGQMPPARLPWKDLCVDSAGVRAFFERVSGDWDSMRSSFYNEKVIDALAERAEVTGTSKVVDVGTGTGFVAAGLAPRAAAVIG